MDITKYAINNDRVTFVFLLIVLVFGITSFFELPQDEDPGFVLRIATVQTVLPGASPTRVEQLVTEKIEKQIQEMPELDYISSKSTTGFSLIFVHIKQEFKDLNPIWDNLREKVESAKSELPNGVIGPKVNDEFGDVTGIIIGLTGEGYSYAELKNIADEVRDELLLLNDVAKVEILGEQQEQIFIEYNNAALTRLGITPMDMQKMLSAQNIIIPGGNIETNDERIVIEPTGNFESIDDIKKIVIKHPKFKTVLFLEDIAKVYRGYIDPPKSKIRVTARDGIGLALTLRDGGNIVNLGDDVIDTISKLQKMYPIGVEFDYISFQPKFVKIKVNDFLSNILQSIIIVIGVMLIFLGIRTGLVVATLIPMAMLMALIFMRLFNIGIDQVSLASLIIALGMLVDNAIVMSESIMVQMSSGKKAIDAAVDSAKELKISLLTSSLTTSAAFLTIFLAKNESGEYTAPLFKVVTITLLCSWFLAITMTPLLCILFIKIKKNTNSNSYDSLFYKSYRKFLLLLLKYRMLTVIGVLILFIIAMLGFSIVPKVFFPKSDKPLFTAELKFPVGTKIEKTENMVKKVEKYIIKELMVNKNRKAGVIKYGTFIGESAPRFTLSFNTEKNVPYYAMFLLTASSNEDASKILIPKLEKYCLDNFPDLIPNVKLISLGPAAAAPIEVRITGKEEDKVFKIIDKVKKKLESLPGLKNIKDDWGMRTKKIVIKVDQSRAKRAGITSQEVAVSLKTIMSGLEVTQYREKNKVIPVIMRSESTDREDIGKLENHNIFIPKTGQTIPLKQVANVEIKWQPSTIFRRNRLKTVTVSTGVEKGISDLEISQFLDKWLKSESENWPIGYKYEIGGSAEKSAKSNKAIMVNLPLVAFIIIMLLIIQFNSIRKPLIILATIPLGLVGVVFGLIIARSFFGFMTLLGVVSLSGIVINNAIVLIDRIKYEIDEMNNSPKDAIVEAAQRRLRPILLTTVTTIGGLLPLWIGGGPLWQTMAVAIIFGLTFSTLLTLGIVPVFYALFFRIKY